MPSVTRSTSTLAQELNNKTDFSYGDKLSLAIEYYIAQLPIADQPAAWQQLPYLVQFGPILVKWGRKMPDVRRVNPGIAYGGLTEYDKTAIYDKIPPTFSLDTIDIAHPEDLTWKNLQEKVLTNLQFPLMIKAQAGERGVGVYYIEDVAACKYHRQQRHAGNIEREALSFQAFSTLQHEYCLQFYQYNDQASIHRVLFGGLTLRDIPTVTGDGHQSVQELMHHLSLSEAQKTKISTTLAQLKPALLTSIPPVGQIVQIVYTASIDYGTVYKRIDLTPAQKEQCVGVLQNILHDMPPSYMCVGRFDLKADSLDDLLQGKLQIIECNAAGGIPTHVYAEDLPIVEKYTELDKHFGIMDNIAQLNKAKYAGLFATLRSRPEFLYISYLSISKKGITIFDTPSSQTQELRKIYKQIFRVLRMSRLSRWGNRFRRIFVKEKT